MTGQQTQMVDLEELCDPCARKGLRVKATHDAPSPAGPWHFVCLACHYRLPAALKVMAHRLVVAR